MTTNNTVVFKTQETTSLILKEYQWICNVFAGHRCELSGTFALWMQNVLPDNRPIHDVDIKIFYWTELERKELIDILLRLKTTNEVNPYSDSCYMRLSNIKFNICLEHITTCTKSLTFTHRGKNIFISPWQSILSWKMLHYREKDILDIQSIMNRTSIFGIDSFKLKEDLL